MGELSKIAYSIPYRLIDADEFSDTLIVFLDISYGYSLTRGEIYRYLLDQFILNCKKGFPAEHQDNVFYSRLKRKYLYFRQEMVAIGADYRLLRMLGESPESFARKFGTYINRPLKPYFSELTAPLHADSYRIVIKKRVYPRRISIWMR